VPADPPGHATFARGGASVGHDVRLLGSWELRIDRELVPVPGVRLRILLTSFALSANQTVGVDTLVEQLWPDQAPEQPRRSLHTYVGRLRKLLGPDLIITAPGGGYRCTIEPEAVDLHRFRALLKRTALATTTHDELDLLRSALGLWRGIPFADLYSTWLDREVTPRLTEEWFAATGRRIELELATGHAAPLIAELRDLTDRYPTREFLWHQLISALHKAGRRADALDAFQQVRRALRDELGIEPGKALVQLQHEILVGGAAQPKDAEQAPRQLPSDLARFTGRDEELATLDGLLPAASGPAAPTIISITGPPGIGKTTLAVHWAHRVAHRCPDAHLYLNLRGYGRGEPLQPGAAVETLLRALGVDTARIPADVDERSALLRSRLADRAVLIVLDNARDAEQVRPLLPGTGGLVIVTSRGQLRGLSITNDVHRVPLNPLPRKQSVELLASRLGAGWVEAEPEAAAALVELCDRLPLALAIVAERAHRVGSLSGVVTALRGEQARLDELDTGEENPDISLRATLSWSYRALSDEAAGMFRKLGLHPANDIDVRAASALAGVPAGPLLDQLVAANLAEQPHPNRYELYDLVRLYATEVAGQESRAESDAAMRRVLDWYLNAAVSADTVLLPHRMRYFLDLSTPDIPPPRFATIRAARAWFEEEYECLCSVTGWAVRHGFAGHAWRIAIAMTTFFHHANRWPDGDEFYRSAVAAARVAGEPLGEGWSLNSVAFMYLDRGDVVTARSYVEQAGAVLRSASDRIGEAMALGNLSLLNGRLGDLDAALRDAKRALALNEELDNPRGIAENFDNMGVAYLTAGEYQLAVDCFKQALEVIDRLGDFQVLSLGQLNLAKAYAGLRDFPNSARAFRRAITLHRTRGNHGWAAIVLADFGSMLVEAGHPDIARAMWRGALATLTEYGDPRADEVRALLG
jgi:DNA-binding SARP family transcriptional activator/tetratricopeptide (TPR) repeat protein